MKKHRYRRVKELWAPAVVVSFKADQVLVPSIDRVDPLRVRDADEVILGGMSEQRGDKARCNNVDRGNLRDRSNTCCLSMSRTAIDNECCIIHHGKMERQGLAFSMSKPAFFFIDRFITASTIWDDKGR
jgi:hypothetical protein